MERGLRPAEGEYGDEEAEGGSSEGPGSEGSSVALPFRGGSEGHEEWLPTIASAQESEADQEDLEELGDGPGSPEFEEEQPLLDELWPEEPSTQQQEEFAVLEEAAGSEALEPGLEPGLEPELEEELPDPLELFERLQQEALLHGVEEDPPALEPAPDEELPDPLELFERLLNEQHEPLESFEQPESTIEEELPDPLELFERMQREAGDLTEEFEPEAGGEDELPDPLELFERLQQQPVLDEQAAPPSPAEPNDGLPPAPAPSGAARGATEEAAEWEEFEEEMPDPQLLFQQLQGMSLEQLELSEPADSPALPDPRALYEQIEAEEEEPAAVGFFGRIRQALFGDRGESKAESLSPPALPDPAELYRQLEEEEPEEPEETGVSGPFAAPRIAAGGWAPVLSELPVEPDEVSPPSAEELPSPEELFRAIEEEYAQESRLPELPDLEAFKAELEAEERARLDPDLLEDLSGPERFVETVSDFDFEAAPLFEEFTSEDTVSPVIEPARTVPAAEASVAPSVLPPPRDSQKAPPTPPAVPGSLAPPRMEGPGDGPLFGAPTKTDQRGTSGTVKVDFTAEDPDYENPPTLLGRKEPSILSRTYQPTATEKRSRGRPGTQAIITQEPGRSALQTTATVGLWQRISRRQRAFDRQSLSVFTRQLGAMLNAGIPLHLALAFCAESDPELAPILSTLVEKVETGYSLSGALSDYPDSFDPVYIGLVQTGELSGRLNEMLSRLADVLERELELKKRMMSVVTYPAMLMVVSLLGTLGFLFFVLPQITPLFFDLEVELPLPTRILLTTKEFLGPGLAGSALLAFIYWATRKRIAAFVNSKPLLKRRLSGMPFRIPILGRVYEKVITARVLYALSTMLDVGVTMNQALARSETAAGNAYIAHRLKGAREDLAEGVPVSECFRNHRVFPDTALHLIAAGEEAARLSEMFSYVAEHFDEEVGYALDSAASMLEPAIMVVMGAVVGFIVVAAALPTIHLLQNFS